MNMPDSNFVAWWEDTYGNSITAEDFINGEFTYQPMQDMYSAFLAAYKIALLAAIEKCERRADSLPHTQCGIARLCGKDIKSLIKE